MTLRSMLVAAASAIALAGSARAQQPPTVTTPVVVPAQAKVPVPVLLKVQFVISRYQGEKKISSEPYTMTVRANEPRTNLRVGLQVAIPTSGPDNKIVVQYRDVGTNIDCAAQTLEDGRFRVDVSLEDSSVVADARGQTPRNDAPPQFRSFRLMNETLVLKDGQTAPLTTATEKASGETAKIDVTLTVIK